MAPKAPIGAAFMMMPMTREHRMRGVVDQAAQRMAALAQPHQREAEQHREEQHLQHVADLEHLRRAGPQPPPSGEVTKAPTTLSGMMCRR